MNRIDGDALIAKIKPTLPEVRTQIVLRPDLVDEWEKANAALENAEAAAAASKRMNGQAGQPANLKKLAEAVRKAESEIEATSPWFTFRAIPAEDYQSMCAKHPPRKDDQLDAYAGHNREAVENALVRECLIDPEFSDEGWATLKATLSPSEWAEMRNSALQANGESVKPPKSLRASLLLGRLDSESE